MLTFILIVLLAAAGVQAEKILVYDEEKGIIFVEKDSAGAIKKTKKKVPKQTPKAQRTVPRANRPNTIKKARGPGDIHVDRKKDPPDLYFKSGLEYYRNDDFENALKNFKHAADRDVKAEYLLWIGKTYRQLDKQVQMFTVMERILKDYQESDVADDALFEMAFYYQKTDDYEKASATYKLLIEQYPFGVSYSSGDEFLDIARKQMQMMRGEMISALKLLGIEGNMLTDAYEQFQKVYKLKDTGEGNPETVKAIKQKYNEKLQEDENIAAAKIRTRKSLKWAYVIGLLLLINTAFILAARVKISQNRKQVGLLKDMFSDLQKG